MKVLSSIGRRLQTWRPTVGKSRGAVCGDAASISGADEDYLSVCRAAAVDPRVFATFRRNPSYTSILEHVTESLGVEYLRSLSPSGRASRGIVEAARNDAVGAPRTMRLRSGVSISPTTLRYLKVADDLQTLFGPIDGADIVEIGVGYGGQCRILDSLYDVKSYTLVDLRPVLDLAAEYLASFALRCTVRFLTMNELPRQKYDLAISNYALTELTRESQEIYLSKALAQTPRGYITYNDICPPEFRSLTCEELCKRLGAKERPEAPLTHPRNRVVVWGALA